MTITKRVAMLLMMLVGLAGLLNAQTDGAVKAQVPFAFVANGKTMPAGECTIAIVEHGPKVLMISCGDHRSFAPAIADESPNAHKKTALVFHQYGDRYFLSSIKRENGSSYRFPLSDPERELQARNVSWEAFTLLASAK